jgi:hypothetical protein
LHGNPLSRILTHQPDSDHPLAAMTIQLKKAFANGDRELRP